MEENQSLPSPTRPDYIALLRRDIGIPSLLPSVIGIDIGLIGVHDDATSFLFFLQSLTVLNEKRPDATHITCIVHLSNHIALSESVAHGCQHVSESAWKYGDVLQLVDSVDQLSSRAAASCHIGLFDLLDNSQYNIHTHMVRVVDVIRCSSSSLG